MKIETTTAFPIHVKTTSDSRLPEMDFNNIVFGKHFSDHMFVMDYKDGTWQKAEILPFDKISIHPATSAIHYGQSIFEGMKAYKTSQGNPVLFRPDQNIERFNKSALRMAMPEVPAELFEQALQKLVALDSDWIPNVEGSSLYIRPFMFATEEFIGIKIADKYRFMIITCPAGMYYPKPVNVVVAQEYVRAFPGGTGFAKAAGNYGAAMHPLRLAQEKGYDQVLWMDGVNFSEIHEIGTMNVFFVTKDKVVTPSTEQGTILKGVTRDSAIQLLRHRGVEVVESKVTIDEVLTAYESGDLLEIFGTGTAATIAQIQRLGYKGEDLEFDPANWEMSNWLKKELTDIREGKKEDVFGWNVEVTG